MYKAYIKKFKVVNLANYENGFFNSVLKLFINKILNIFAVGFILVVRFDCLLVLFHLSGIGLGLRVDFVRHFT